MTYQEKVKLSTDVRELTQVQLGEVVKIIRAKSPNAYKEVDKDNCQIVVDSLDKTTYLELCEYISNCQSSSNRKSKA